MVGGAAEFGLRGAGPRPAAPASGAGPPPPGPRGGGGGAASLPLGGWGTPPSPPAEEFAELGELWGGGGDDQGPVADVLALALGGVAAVALGSILFKSLFVALIAGFAVIKYSTFAFVTILCVAYFL